MLEFSYDFNAHVPLPKPTGAWDHHSTCCAGQVVARRNDACRVGIAYDSKAVAARILGSPITVVNKAAALNLGFGVIDDIRERYVIVHDDEEMFLQNLSNFDNWGSDSRHDDSRTPVLSPTVMALNASFSPSFSISPPPGEPLLHLDHPVFCAALIDNNQNCFQINGECVQTSDEDTSTWRANLRSSMSQLHPIEQALLNCLKSHSRPLPKSTCTVDLGCTPKVSCKPIKITNE